MIHYVTDGRSDPAKLACGLPWKEPDQALARCPWPLPEDHWMRPVAEKEVTCPRCRKAVGLTDLNQ